MATPETTATGAPEQKDEVMEPQDEILALEVANHNNEEERMARVQAEEEAARQAAECVRLQKELSVMQSQAERFKELASKSEISQVDSELATRMAELGHDKKPGTQRPKIAKATEISCEFTTAFKTSISQGHSRQCNGQKRQQGQASCAKVDTTGPRDRRQTRHNRKPRTNARISAFRFIGGG